jgi:hypothetical protein
VNSRNLQQHRTTRGTAAAGALLHAHNCRPVSKQPREVDVALSPEVSMCMDEGGKHSTVCLQLFPWHRSVGDAQFRSTEVARLVSPVHLLI